MKVMAFRSNEVGKPAFRSCAGLLALGMALMGTRGSLAAETPGPPVADPLFPTATLAATAAACPPTAVADSYSVDEDAILTVAAPGVLRNDTDPDGDVLTAVLVMESDHGTVSLNPNGSFSYLPNWNFHGTDSFLYQAHDGTATSAPVAVTLTVPSVNDVPVARKDTYSMAEDGVLMIDAPGVLGNDFDLDGEALAATRVELPIHGTLVFKAEGSLTYRPHPDFHGTDTFTYTATEGITNSRPATVTILVTPVEDAPTAQPLQAAALQNTPLCWSTAAILATASDADNDPLELAAFAAGSDQGGTIELAESRLTYRPPPDGLGSDAFTVVIADGHGGAVTNTVRVAVVAPVCEALGTLQFNPQTGLHEQTLRLTNPLPPQECGTAQAVQVFIDGLPSNATVPNASGTNLGRVFVLCNAPLPPGQSATLAIECHLPDPVNPPSPTYTARVANPAPPVAIDGVPSRIERILQLEDGRILIEFNSVPGRTYALQSSGDLRSWQTATPLHVATADSVQWIDTSPPPSAGDSGSARWRFYRLFLLSDP
ncbi:MAG: tandem-95 repeat protein [Verrucomicrobia bacterium]|nr:tandem-95 repeat protein [Verrucomicrobiota bacterium]